MTTPMGSRRHRPSDDVRRLHTALLRMPADIATDELVDARYGPTTRRGVAEFQRAHKLPVTGTVDGATRDAVQMVLAEPPSRFVVVGRVRWVDGQPANALTVGAFDRDLRDAEQLGEATTGDDGLYRVDYSRDRFTRSEKQSADLFVRVSAGDRLLSDPPLSAVLFNAPELAVLTVDLSGGGDRERSEYERILATIVPLLGQVPLYELRQDDEAEDVTFLAAETGLPATALAHFGVAQKLAASYKLPAVFGYALFAERTLLTTSRTGAALARFDVDLNTELRPLYYDIALLDEQTVRNAVADAVRHRYVPEDLLGELDRILDMLARVRPEAKEYVAQERPKVLYARVERFLADGAHERVQNLLAVDAAGDLPGLIAQLADAAAFPDRSAAEAAGAASVLADVLGYDETIVDRVLDREGIEGAADVRRLARLAPADWRRVLRDSTTDVRVAGQPVRPELIDLHAGALARKLERRYPTTAFTAQLERDAGAVAGTAANAAADADTAGERSDGGGDRPGHGRRADPSEQPGNDERASAVERAFGGHRDAVLELLTANPDFDLATGNVERLLRDHPERLRTGRPALKAAQRIFKLAPTYRQTTALLAAEVPSAARIHALGETRFVATAVNTGRFTDEQARSVYRRAVDVHVASGLLAGELQSAARALPVRALGGSAAPDLTPVSADFPNLSSLFQLADSSYCEPCRSVHSAAAYLVDVLQFLGNRLVTDADTPGPATKVARDVLYGRRPDLGDLDLSCENTDLPLPYLDLVCELLEEAVAPDVGLAFGGPLSGGVDPVEAPSAGLLGLLQGQGWPFTDRSLVYEPDLAGARVVRDIGVVAKATPDGAGGWFVRRLRQTTGTALELAAAPQYVNAAAYTLLAGSRYAFALPFDLAHEETRSYFAQFDIARADVMRALRRSAGPSGEAIAAEELGISDAQRQLVVTADPAAQDDIWNTAPLGALGGIARVDNFLARARLDYRELTELLALAWVNPGNAMFVKHLDTGSDLSAKRIQQLTDARLDRIHRFLRLLRAPACTGWTPPLLDRTIRADALGGGALDDDLLVTVAALHRLAARLGLPLPEVVDLFAPLDESRYAEVYRNSANGPVLEAFEPANVLANEQAELTTPGSGAPLSAHEAYLATCLGATTADTALLVADLPAPAIVSNVGLHAVYAGTLLARALGLTATEYLIMKGLIGSDPLTAPATALAFVERFDAARSGTGIRPADLRYLLRHEADDLAARDLPDETLTAVLTGLQAAYQSGYAATRPAVDPAAPPEENLPGMRALLATVPGMTEADLAGFASIVDGGWTDAVTTPAQFVDAKLAALVDTTPITAAIVASPTEAQQTTLLLAITTALSSYAYTRTKQELAVAAVADTFGFSADAAATVLAGAELTRPLLAVLTDDALVDLVNEPPAPPAVTPAGFDEQYRALRLLHVLSRLVEHLTVPDADLGWLLANAGSLGWLAPDRVPYQTGRPPAPLADWIRLAAGVELACTYPPVANPLDAAAPWTVYGLFDLVLAAGTTATQVHTHLAQLGGWDATVLADLDTHLELSAVDLTAYRSPVTIQRLVDALTLLRRLGLPVAAAVPLGQPVTTAAGAATMRQALKARYAEAEWFGVLQGVQDRLRVAKRDALVAYLLAENPGLRDTNDLYDHFLIDVEMGACMATSRIVQAHATVQLFVQRCLLGLEPDSVAAVTEDPGWDQWNWMANYRVWEANRKIFLYPENWILPELRDDKSELFTELDDQLQQDELTDLAVENATITYLEKLDDLAHLDVMACYYQHDRHLMHVFARTRGGDPTVYYHRQFERERYWTPWRRVPLDIAGDHLLAFDRNSRLTLAWPVFTQETDTAQTSQIPDPDGIPPGGTETERPRRRWRIQLAIGERTQDRWQPKKISKDALYYPASGYREDLPAADEFTCFAYAAGAAGQAISVLTGTEFVGSFALTGCRGFPEPVPGGGSGNLLLSPVFKDTELLAERFTELVSRTQNDLAISTPLMGAFQTLVAQTPGRFRVTYPMQMSLLDWIIMLLGLAQSVRGTHDRRPVLPLGTLMPYFYGDYDRGYVIIPGFYDRRAEDPADRIEKTYSDVDEFARDVLALLTEYLRRYAEDPAHDLAAAVQAMTEDAEYHRLVAEFEVYGTLSYGVRFANFYHPLLCFLRATVYRSGVPALLSRTTQLTNTGFDFAATYQPAPVVVSPYPVEDLDFAADGAYAGYNWELFYHLPFDIALRLNRDQRFAEARNWFHHIFNPVGTADGAAAPQKYWVTKPFFQTGVPELLNQRIGDILTAIAADPSGASITDLKFAVEQWRAKPFNPHVVARSRPVAYQLAVVVSYIKNLVDWGDQLFRQFTRESVTQATQLYILADKLLGPKPSVVPPLVSPAPATVNQLQAKVDLFGNALLDLENLIPDLDLLPHGGAELPSPLSYSALYFCVPPNEEMLRLWDLIADRLFKIRNCQNIDGVESMLALFSPPIDPGALVRAAAAGMSVSSFLAGLGAPLPNYRFRVLAQKATELVGYVGELGGGLLAAMEKRDAEQLTRLRAGQEIALLDAVRAVKVATIAEAEGNVAALELSRKVVEERQRYYAGRPYMNAWEITATALSGVSLLGETAIAVGYILSGGLKLIPNFTAGGAGFGGSPTVTLTLGGDKAGAAADSAVMTLEAIARALDKAAGMAANQGGYRRRMDDWEHQAALAGLELTQLDQQLLTGRLHVSMLTDELAAHDREADNARATEEYLRGKYTNTELYQWMVSRASSVYFGAYQLAFDVAKKAERCFAHELGSEATFLQPGYWDSLRKGLTVADALRHDLKRMEVAYLDQHSRERELTRHVSLAQLDPAALIELRATGSCVVNVPEALFDLDHPGHYFRRLRTVSLSIPCVAGPYTPVTAKLSLIGNRYRTATAARQGATSAKDKYAEAPGDERFAYNVGGIESISTSSGLSDSGMFELNFADDRYLPFEGKGAIGTWRLELPTAVRQFDYDSISDVILHLRYTARDGGSTLRGLVEDSLREVLNEMLVDADRTGLYQAYSLRHHFPDEWWQLTQQQSTELAIGPEHLPYLARDHQPVVDQVTWYARVDGDPGTYDLTVAGDPVTLNRDADLRQCVGQSDPLVLGTPVTLAADPDGLTDLVVLLHYRLDG
ncbi:neuraminidase-like domain-containing protein [Micromonospora arida]|uniref:Tc toxin subunit A-related protein n=1 Tax=Micromonospora arida TaxID=2203715 RepID=UPI00340E3208